MDNNKIIPKNSGNKGAYIAAVNLMASDLTLSYKDIANKKINTTHTKTTR